MKKIIFLVVLFAMLAAPAIAQTTEYSTGTVTANADVVGSEKTKAFDNIYTDQWIAGTLAPEWIMLDYGAGNSHIINNYTITGYTVANSPLQWYLQGSNNGVNFDLIDDKTLSNMTWTARENKTFKNYSVTTAYRYIRLYITTSPTGGDGVTELKFYSDNQTFASFTQNKTFGIYSFPVQFNDTSSITPDSSYWNFGDSSTSTEVNPVHTYTTSGLYNVSHKATTLNGSSWYNTTSSVDSLPPIVNPDPVYTWSVLNVTATDSALTGQPDFSTSEIYKGNLVFTHQSNSSLTRDNYVTSVNLSTTALTNVYTQNGAYTAWRVKNINNTLFLLLSSNGAGTFTNNSFWLYNTTDLKTWNTYLSKPNNGNFAEDFIFYNGRLLLSGTSGTVTLVSDASSIIYTAILADPEDGTTIQQPNSSLLVIGGAYPLDFLTSNNGVSYSWSGNATMFDWGFHSTVNGNYIVYPGHEGGATKPEGMAVYDWRTGKYSQNNLGYWFSDATATPNMIGGTNGTYYAGSNYGNGSTIFYYNLDSTLGSRSMVWTGLNSTVVSMKKDSDYSVYALVRSIDRAHMYVLKGTPTSLPPVADFVCVPTNITLGNSMSCTDLTTNTPTNWYWEFGDGNTSTVQNPTYTYPFKGTFNVNLFANNSAGGSWSNKTGYVTVSNGSGIVHQDVVMDPLYLLTIHFTDTTTGAAIPVVTVTTSDGQTQTTTNGTAYFSEPYSTIVVYASATGYVGTSSSYVMDSDRDEVIQMVPAITTPALNTWYSQKLVKITVVNTNGNPIIGANTSMNFLASSLPNTDISWIQSAFGVTALVAEQMQNSTLTMTSNTGDDGAVSFMVFPGFRYGVTIVNTTTGLNHYTTIHPSDTDYIIYCPTTNQYAGNQTQTQLVNTSLFITEPNVSYVTFNLRYQDTSSLTTSVTWNVTNTDNMTPMYYKTFASPGINVILDNYTVPNIRGQQWKFFYNATRSAKS